MSSVAPATPLRRAAGPAAVLWRFSRPHTIVGTTLSIIGIYAIAVAELPALGLVDGLVNLGWTLLAGLCVNVAIVGINQLEDVQIDRVNKPELPLPAGDLTPGAARAIVVACAVLPVVLALSQGPIETGAVLVALAIGAAYSMPPVRLKRSPALAALSITFVRAVVLTLGVWLHFASSLGGRASLADVPAAIWALAVFVLPFAFAIAVLKDVPDAEGDRRFGIRTFTVRFGAPPVVAMALAALTTAYLAMVGLGPLVLSSAQPAVLVVGHLGALAALWTWASDADPGETGSFTRFYLRIWLLFFCEQALLPLAVVTG